MACLGLGLFFGGRRRGQDWEVDDLGHFRSRFPG
jgi:hypothetical protein